MSTATKTRSIYFAADHLDKVTADHLTMVLRQADLKGLFGTDNVTHKVRLLADGTERHEVIVTASGEQTGDLVRVLAENWDRELVPADDDLVTLVDVLFDEDDEPEPRRSTVRTVALALMPWTLVLAAVMVLVVAGALVLGTKLIG